MVSPLNCIQELAPADRHYPWRVMVVCALLNQTHGRQVRPMIDEFWALVPEPSVLLHLDREAADRLRELLRPLGFAQRRLGTLYRMTADYLNDVPWERCYGVGPYCRDSLAIFVYGQTDVNPSDKWLRPYLKWRLEGGPRQAWDGAKDT